jgi:prepilin-type N-terminal cleavage/methylation domain-containing protein
VIILTRGARRIRAAYQGRKADGRRATRRRIRDDAGMTLMELLVASSVLVVLLTAVMLSMNMLDTVSTSLSSQYQEYDTALPAFASLQSLIRAEVEPAACSYPNPVNPCNGHVTPGFQSIGNSSVTFTANIGTSYGNVTASGLTAGPAQITAGEFSASGAPVTTASTCTVTSPCTFQVREYLPSLQANGLPTCPTTENLSGTCQWQSTYTLITNVQEVTNNPLTQPIFTYTVANPLPSTYGSCVLTQSEVSNQVLAGSSSQTCGYPNAAGNAGFGCTLPTVNVNLPAMAVSCPLDSIQSVGIDLLVANKGSGKATIESQGIFYRYQQITGTSYTYTYPYTPGVG